MKKCINTDCPDNDQETVGGCRSYVVDKISSCPKSKAITISRKPDAVLSNSTELLCDDSQGGMRLKMYTYRDMVAAFTAGRLNQKECGETENDYWDFASWCYENYGT